jgi:phage major head subunit gpT-like protein
MLTNIGSNPNLLEPIVRKAFLDGFGNIPEETEMFFDVGTSTKDHETLLSYGDMGAVGKFTGSLDYDELKENYTKTIYNYEYARGLAIQRKLWETDQVRVVKKLPNLLGQRMKGRRLVDTYALLNSAFTATYTGGDSLAMCSTAHTSAVGGANQVNSGSSALSPAAVTATHTAMAKFNTNRDNPLFDTAPDAIIVPIDLEDYASEIVKSKGKVDSMNNNVNIHFGRYKVIASRCLTDANNWFMVNTKKMKDNQVWFNVVNTELNKDVDFNSFAKRWSVYAFYGFGFERWEHIYGHSVS